MCLLIWTVFSGERCGPWASCLFVCLVFFVPLDCGGGAEVERWPRKREVGCSNPDRPKSLKQVVTLPLPNTQHQVRMSQVHGDDLKNGCQNLQPFTGDVSIWVKDSQAGRKTPKQSINRPSFTHMETSPLPVKGCKFLPILGTNGHWAVRVL